MINVVGHYQETRVEHGGWALNSTGQGQRVPPDPCVQTLQKVNYSLVPQPHVYLEDSTHLGHSPRHRKGRRARTVLETALKAYMENVLERKKEASGDEPQ